MSRPAIQADITHTHLLAPATAAASAGSPSSPMSPCEDGFFYVHRDKALPGNVMFDEPAPRPAAATFGGPDAEDEHDSIDHLLHCLATDPNLDIGRAIDQMDPVSAYTRRQIDAIMTSTPMQAPPPRWFLPPPSIAAKRTTIAPQSSVTRGSSVHLPPAGQSQPTGSSSGGPGGHLTPNRSPVDGSATFPMAHATSSSFDKESLVGFTPIPATPVQRTLPLLGAVSGSGEHLGSGGSGRGSAMDTTAPTTATTVHQPHAPPPGGAALPRSRLHRESTSANLVSSSGVFEGGPPLLADGASLMSNRSPSVVVHSSNRTNAVDDATRAILAQFNSGVPMLDPKTVYTPPTAIPHPSGGPITPPPRPTRTLSFRIHVAMPDDVPLGLRSHFATQTFVPSAAAAFLGGLPGPSTGVHFHGCAVARIAPSPPPTGLEENVHSVTASPQLMRVPQSGAVPGDGGAGGPTAMQRQVSNSSCFATAAAAAAPAAAAAAAAGGSLRPPPQRRATLTSAMPQAQGSTNSSGGGSSGIGCPAMFDNADCTVVVTNSGMTVALPVTPVASLSHRESIFSPTASTAPAALPQMYVFPFDAIADVSVAADGAIEFLLKDGPDRSCLPDGACESACITPEGSPSTSYRFQHPQQQGTLRIQCSPGTPGLQLMATVSRAMLARQQQVQRTSKKTLTIVHFNDVYNLAPGRVGENDACLGGASRFHSLLQELRENSTNPLVLFSGDFMGPSLMSVEMKGKQMIDFFNLCGVHYGCLGNHEFDYGMKALTEALNGFTHGAFVFTGSTTQWVMSNMVDAEGRPVCGASQYQLFQWNGVTVGLLGLCEDWVGGCSQLAHGEVVYLDVFETGEALAQKLKNEGAEIVIALTHNRLPNDQLLMQRCPSIDLLLGGHDHFYKCVPGLRIVKSGEEFQFLTEVNIDIATTVAPTTAAPVVAVSPSLRSAEALTSSVHLVERSPSTAELVETPSALNFKATNFNFNANATVTTSTSLAIRVTAHPVTSNIPTSPPVEKLLRRYQSKLDERMGGVIGRTAVDVDPRESACRFKEGLLTGFVCDVIAMEMRRVVAGCDFAVLGGAAFSGKSIIPAGTLTVGDIFNLFPNDTRVMCVRLRGSTVLKLLLTMARDVPDEAPSFPHCSGELRFTINAIHKPPTVESVYIHNEPLDEARSYIVAVEDFAGKGCGKYKFIPKEGEVLLEEENAKQIVFWLIDYFNLRKGQKEAAALQSSGSGRSAADLGQSVMMSAAPFPDSRHEEDVKAVGASQRSDDLEPRSPWNADGLQQGFVEPRCILPLRLMNISSVISSLSDPDVLSRYVAATSILADDSDLTVVFQKIELLVVKCLQCETARVLHFDETASVFRLRRGAREVVIPADESSVAGYCLLHRCIINIKNPQEPFFAASIEGRASKAIKSMLSFPILYKRKVLAIVQAINRKRPPQNPVGGGIAGRRASVQPRRLSLGPQAALLGSSDGAKLSPNAAVAGIVPWKAFTDDTQSPNATPNSKSLQPLAMEDPETDLFFEEPSETPEQRELDSPTGDGRRSPFLLANSRLGGSQKGTSVVSIFSEVDQSLSHLAAKQIGIQLHFSMVLDRMNRSELATKNLMDMARLLGTTKSDDSVTTMVLRITDVGKQLIGCDRCSLFLIEKGEMWTVVKSKDQTTNVTIRLPLGHGVVGRAAETGKLMNVHDAYKCEYFNKDVDIKTGYRTKTILAVPMMSENKDVILGVLQLINKNDGTVFSPQDVAMALNFCALAAIAVHNSFEIETLRLGRDVSTLQVLPVHDLHRITIKAGWRNMRVRMAELTRALRASSSSDSQASPNASTANLLDLPANPPEIYMSGSFADGDVSPSEASPRNTPTDNPLLAMSALVKRDAHGRISTAAVVQAAVAVQYLAMVKPTSQQARSPRSPSVIHVQPSAMRRFSSGSASSGGGSDHPAAVSSPNRRASVSQQQAMNSSWMEAMVLLSVDHDAHADDLGDDDEV